MNLHDILLNKASHQLLGHFYVLETSAPEEQAAGILMNFVQKFIKEYYQQIEGHKQSLSNLMDHPDVFMLGHSSDDRENSERPYKVEQAQTLARFFEFKPVQGKRKFCVINDAHRINPLIANKWLKLFEEPQGVSTIFLLNPRRCQLLSTIHSRAIQLRLPSETPSTHFAHWNEFILKIKNMEISKIIENYSKAEMDLGYWVNELIKWESEQENQASAKIELMKWIKSFQEMEVFNQPTATKWALFHSYLKSNVLPRLN